MPFPVEKKRIFVGAVFFALALFAIPTLVTMRQQVFSLNSLAAGDVQCTSLPPETPEPLESATAANSAAVISQVAPIIQNDTKTFYNGRDPVKAKRMVDNLNRRKRALRTIMRHNLDRALAVIKQSLQADVT